MKTPITVSFELKKPMDILKTIDSDDSPRTDIDDSGEVKTSDGEIIP